MTKPADAPTWMLHARRCHELAPTTAPPGLRYPLRADEARERLRRVLERERAGKGQRVIAWAGERTEAVK